MNFLFRIIAKIQGFLAVRRDPVAKILQQERRKLAKEMRKEIIKQG